MHLWPGLCVVCKDQARPSSVPAAPDPPQQLSALPGPMFLNPESRAQQGHLAALSTHTGPAGLPCPWLPKLSFCQCFLSIMRCSPAQPDHHFPFQWQSCFHPRCRAGSSPIPRRSGRGLCGLALASLLQQPLISSPGRSALKWQGSVCEGQPGLG